MRMFTKQFTKLLKRVLFFTLPHSSASLFTLNLAFTFVFTMIFTDWLGGLSVFAFQAAPPQPNLVALSYTPPPPPDRGAPGNRGEGASRSCTAGSQSLMALVPEQSLNAATNTAVMTQVWGLTSTAHPRLWFSVPYDAAKVSAIEFILQNDQDQTVYRTSVAVPSMPGVISVQLPVTLSGLEIDQPYHWFFKVRAVCEPNQAATLDYVEGWIQRIHLNPELVNRLAQASPQQQASLYAENGIWYDALTTLADLRLAEPENLSVAQDWTDLLRTIELENLATQPLIR
jgi:hypothetical protein